MDLVVQKALKEYHGIDAVIVRPWNTLQDGINIKIELKGNPGLSIVLDRDYWVIKSDKKNSTMYMMNPKDGQSGININIGTDAQLRSDKDLKKDPGFTKITRESGKIGTTAITWRRWSDENQLYSDCEVLLSSKKGERTKQYKITLQITANSPERRSLLEQKVSSLVLIDK